MLFQHPIYPLGCTYPQRHHRYTIVYDDHRDDQDDIDEGIDDDDDVGGGDEGGDGGLLLLISVLHLIYLNWTQNLVIIQSVHRRRFL